MKSLLLLVVLALITACTGSSGVLVMGPDTFSVTGSASAYRGGYSEGRRIALESANAHCSMLGKSILVTNVDTVDREDLAPSTVVTFRCLNDGDQELRRPSYSAEPDVLIEDRRK